MSIVKKLLLFFIIMIFLFILLILFKRKLSLIQDSYKTEGYSNINTPDKDYFDKEVKGISLDTVTYPSGITDSNYNLKLNQYCIKGSANSAYSGGYISDTMVQYVLSRGCRVLDFEVYYLQDKNSNYNAFVGYSSDPKATTPYISNTTQLLFNDILDTTLTTAFTKQPSSKYMVTNTEDPLIINIRLKANKDNILNLLKIVNDSIANVLYNKYANHYINEKITGNTLFNTIKNKLIVVYDSTLFIENSLLDRITNSNLFYNMIGNSKNLFKSTYNEIIPTNNYKKTPPKIISSTEVKLFNNSSSLQYVLPENSKSSQPNPDIYSSIKNYGNQITLFQYYVMDNPLIYNEQMFQTYKSAFVPMSNCLTYIDNNNETTILS